MQEYFRRSGVSTALDGLGFHFLALLLSLCWFTLLWGLRLPTLTAGFALYLMIVSLRRKTRDGRVKRREAKLRKRIGGELALERLLMTAPDKAHFEMAMLLSLRWPLTLLRTGDRGVLCEYRGEKLLIAFQQSPIGEPAGARDVLTLQREAALQGADRGVLCVPGDISPKIREQASLPLPVSFLDREQLIHLFGCANPATNAQLVALGRRKKRLPLRKWSATVLSPRRARRYACYGGLLLLLYQLSGLFYYVIPGFLCLVLAAACRCAREKEEWL
ncbi:MAG: hypothetical protein IKP32_08185 [Clostridia bacterium]|nr:hypothetical protein [Clostridia bacterium]